MAERSIVLSVDNLKKRIRDKHIIHGISFEVLAGEVFGFLGPNGAGKTTTIRMLVGLIEPTEGSIVICGHPLKQRPIEALAEIGCIVENPELYMYLTGWENLEHFARMLPNVDQARIGEVVGIVGMDQRIHDKVRTYSLGMRQRLGIAQALLGRPKLLILDEPTNGLDPQGIKEMRQFIRMLADSGISVFVSSHMLGEIQQMCDRVAIISHGRVIAVGEVEELLSGTRKAIAWHVAPYDRALSLLHASGAVDVTEERAEEGGGLLPPGGGVIVTEIDPADVPSVTRMLTEANVDIYAAAPKFPTLEDLFLRLTEGERIE